MSRTARIRAAAELATVQTTDRQGRVKSLSVPGHTAYRKVLLSRITNTPHPILGVECLMVTPLGLVSCKGNWRTVCYHGQGGVERALEEAHVAVLYWLKAKDEDKAIREACKIRNLVQFQESKLGCVVAKRRGRYGGRVWFLWKGKE